MRQWCSGLGVLQGITEFLPISSDGHLATAAMLFTVPTRPVSMATWLKWACSIRPR